MLKRKKNCSACILLIVKNVVLPAKVLMSVFGFYLDSDTNVSNIDFQGKETYFCHPVNHSINWRLIFPDKRSNLSQINHLPVSFFFFFFFFFLYPGSWYLPICQKLKWLARWQFVNKTKIIRSRNPETTEYRIEINNKILIKKDNSWEKKQCYYFNVLSIINISLVFFSKPPLVMLCPIGWGCRIH